MWLLGVRSDINSYLFRPQLRGLFSNVNKTVTIVPGNLVPLASKDAEIHVMYNTNQIHKKKNKLGLSCAKLSLASAKLHTSLSSDQLKLATN